MFRRDATGKVVPVYLGEYYRGFDIFLTYKVRCWSGVYKLYPVWMGRNPYDDTDIVQENIVNAPRCGFWLNKKDICDWIDNYTYLAQPDNNEDLCWSRFDIDIDSLNYRPDI